MSYDMEAMDQVVRDLARQVGRKFRTVAFDDLYQQGWVWVLSHPAKVQEFTEDEDSKRALRRLESQVTRAMQLMARREKAFKAGYQVEDEAYYNAALIETVLPAVFDPELADCPPQGEHHEITAAADPSVQNPWPVHLADVSRAFKRASVHMDASTLSMLGLRYHGHKPIALIAAVHETGIVEVERALKGALRKIIEELGGDRPRECERGCECSATG